MRLSRVLLIALFLIGATDRPGRAEDGAASVIAAALKAMGGEARIAKYRATSFRVTGTFHTQGVAVSFTGQEAAQLPDRSRVAVEGTVMGNKLSLVTVIAGDKGWTKVNGETRELDKQELHEEHEQLYADWVSSLVPLKQKGFRLQALPEAKVDERAAEAVRVTHEGHRDVTLFFDKQTHFLIKVECPAKDESGKQVRQESFFSNYKEIDGIQEPMKVFVKRDGQPYIESENSELKHLEKLDDSAFAKP